MGCPCPISRAASEALPTGIRLSRAAAARSLCIAPIEVEGHVVTSAAPTQTKTRHVLMRELPFLTQSDTPSSTASLLQCAPCDGQTRTPSAGGDVGHDHRPTDGCESPVLSTSES